MLIHKTERVILADRVNYARLMSGIGELTLLLCGTHRFRPCGSVSRWRCRAALARPMAARRFPLAKRRQQADQSSDAAFQTFQTPRLSQVS
jgi:Fe-S-cluster containining protein